MDNAPVETVVVLLNLVRRTKSCIVRVECYIHRLSRIGFPPRCPMKQTPSYIVIESVLARIKLVSLALEKYQTGTPGAVTQRLR